MSSNWHILQPYSLMHLYTHTHVYLYMGFPCGLAGKEPVCNAGDLGLVPGLGRSPGEGKATHCSILAWRIPWSRKELDMTERLSQSDNYAIK